MVSIRCTAMPVRISTLFFSQLRIRHSITDTEELDWGNTRPSASIFKGTPRCSNHLIVSFQSNLCKVFLSKFFPRGYAAEKSLNCVALPLVTLQRPPPL